MSPGEMLHILIFGLPVPIEMLDPNYPIFLQSIGGLMLTLTITVLSVLMGMPLGLILAVGRSRGPHTKRTGIMCRAANIVCTVSVEGIRGIPIMILLLLVFYLPFRLLGVRVPPVVLAVSVFTLYSGIYLSEMFRSGFRAVTQGWVEAGRILGLSRWQILLRIKVPIAVRAMTPALLGLLITVFKDTSVLTIVAVPELTYSSRILQTSEPISYGVAMLFVIAIYWTLATLASILAARLERDRRT